MFPEANFWMVRKRFVLNIINKKIFDELFRKCNEKCNEMKSNQL